MENQPPPQAPLRHPDPRDMYGGGGSNGYPAPDRAYHGNGYTGPAAGVPPSDTSDDGWLYTATPQVTTPVEPWTDRFSRLHKALIKVAESDGEKDAGLELTLVSHLAILMPSFYFETTSDCGTSIN